MMIVDENGMCTLSEEDRSYHSNYKPRPLTNGDRIRAMTDEELANVLSWLNDSKTADAWLEWMRQEAEE